MIDKYTGQEIVSPLDTLEDATDGGFQHPTLGHLTREEFYYMRQVPIGGSQVDWSQERLGNVRKLLERQAARKARQKCAPL